MWKIVKITAKNFISFRELEFQPTNNVCTLIYGYNKDNDSQPANGSGKSSLVEAIAYAITGEALRKVKDDEVISDWADDAELCITFENDFNQDIFDVKRMIFRKGAQQIVTKLNGEEVVQPTVLDYNRYVMEMLGITKTELYNNFILCRNKYESFLEANDKTKKELINKFSGGDMVDESLELLSVDLDGAKEVMDDAQKSVVAAQAKMDAVQEQIDNAEQQVTSAKIAKAEKIENLRQKITEKREAVRAAKEQIKKADARLNALEEAQDPLEDMEHGDFTFNDCYTDICMLFEDLKLPAIKNYPESAVRYNTDIKEKQDVIDNCSDKIKNVSVQLSKAEKDCEYAESLFLKTQEQLRESDEKAESMIYALTGKREDIRKYILQLRETINETSKIIAVTQQTIATCDAQINGKITCPKCHHEFVLSGDKTLEEIYKEKEKADTYLASLQVRFQEVDDEIAKSNLEIDKIETASQKVRTETDKMHDDVGKLRRAYVAAEKQLADLRSVMATLENDSNAAKLGIEMLEGKLKNLRNLMFDEAYNTIDAAMTKGEAYLDAQKTQVTSLESAIESYEQSIKELENSDTGDITVSLRESLKKYEAELIDANDYYNKVKSAYGTLKEQENHFIDFKSFLANSKIEALSQMINDFMAKIGSDIRLELVGYTRLKSGKLRDKISINILRDGVDCGSFYKFSQGEKTRINLASILALQKLVNTSAPEGKGLDLLIADEILDASDTGGLMSYCETITKLGITALVISQNQLPENYPHQMVVTKENGYSKIG